MVVPGKIAPLLQPQHIQYRAEDTLRRPGARMTPVSRICTLRQVWASKSDAKGDSSGTMASSRLGMMNLW